MIIETYYLFFQCYYIKLFISNFLFFKRSQVPQVNNFHAMNVATVYPVNDADVRETISEEDEEHHQESEYFFHSFCCYII